MQDNYVVIMAGGVGTRFWPFSRQSFPKQFHDVLGTGRTLLQQTADRFEGVCPKENIYIVTGEPYKEITAEQLPYLSNDQILCEPGRRNTAPCIAYACFKIASKNPNAKIVVAPADHVIIKEEEFKRRILIALDFAGENDALLTLGIKPTHPNTGYGYIHFEENEGEVHEVKTFTEKPSFDLATKFVASGDYVWNAGIFIWSAKAVDKAFSKHLPEMHEAFLQAKPHFYTEKETEALAEAYPQCRKVSIDNGLMEKADNVHVVLSDIGWSDLGTWKSVYELSEKDEQNNAIDGNVMLRNSKGCIVKTPKDKLVVVNGVSGLIISEFQNVLMICKLEDEQEVKQLVGLAEGRGKEYV